MRKRIVIALTAVLVVFIPVFALGEETRSVSDICQEVSQAQTSEDMVHAIEDAFEAMKVEARADDVRVKETTPELLRFGDDEEDDDSSIPICTITRDGKEMRYCLAVKGEPDEAGYPLYITFHGGGTDTESGDNDTAWYGMYDYYRPVIDHGIYVACRGMEDVWNMHSLPDAYAMYDRIIEDMVLLKGADPNRVYLLGYSAGGDGVYEVTPRMADRFAAANMSAGHPNSVSLLNVANVPFEIQVGVRDYYTASGMRSVRGAEFEQILSDYHDTYGFGYEHRVLVHLPDGHTLKDKSEGSDPNALVLTDPVAFANRAVSENWLDAFVDIYRTYYGDDTYDQLVDKLSYEAGEDQAKYNDFSAALMKKITGTDEGEYGMQTETVDTDATHYVNKFTRNSCPTQVVWDLATRASRRSVSSFYWLKADKSVDKGQIVASFDAESNTFTLNPSDDVAGDFSVLVNPRMVDVTRPVVFATPKGNFTVTVAADPAVMEASLREVCDPFLAWVQEVSYQQLLSSEVSSKEPEGDDAQPAAEPESAPANDNVEPAATPVREVVQSASAPAAASANSTARPSSTASTSSRLADTGDAAMPASLIAAAGLVAIASSLCRRIIWGGRGDV